MERAGSGPGRGACSRCKHEEGSIYWSSKVDSTSNSSGFSAVPGGFMEDPSDVVYPYMGDMGFFWTDGEKSRSAALFRYVDIDNDQFKSGNGSKEYGLTVRCLKD